MPEAPKLTQKLEYPTAEPKVSEPRLNPNLPAYPTENQMDTMFNAYMNGGEAGILAALNAARQKREQSTAEDVRAARYEVKGK